MCQATDDGLRPDRKAKQRDLWQSQDKRQKAYDVLALVYDWLTEGFDTADLQEAKALLMELEK
jgi:hypothetical protein